MAVVIKAGLVAWVPPEAKVALLGSRQACPTDKYAGEYRTVKANSDGTVTFGELVCWVDDTPTNSFDPTGHFEGYAGVPSNYLSAVMAVVKGGGKK